MAKNSVRDIGRTTYRPTEPEVLPLLRVLVLELDTSGHPTSAP